MKNKIKYNSIKESEFYNEIFENLIRHNFNYKFDENKIVIYSGDKETLTYNSPGLLKNLKAYLTAM